MKVKLKLWRMRRGMTMKQLAEAAGVSEQTIVRIETHGVIPFPRTLDKLAKALHVGTEELLVEDDEPLQKVSEASLL
jgi:transcriptional regulator with XRE-family HTH domain